MSLTNLQNKEFTVVAPIEIDQACNEIRILLKDNLPWVSHAYHIAQRFFKKEENRNFIYPETYIKNPTDSVYKYHRLTPDNSYSGMFFFMVGSEKIDFAPAENNYLTYPVSIIFSANLELIDKARLKNDGLFTQDLIKMVRRALTEGAINFDFDYKLLSITRDLREVYKEFSLNDLEQYNRAPLQCFRVDLSIMLQEECVNP